MQEPIDFNNPTADIKATNNGKDPAGVRTGRIYGFDAEMLRLQNAYRPNPLGKYDINKVLRKRADYELKQLQNAFVNERIAYAKENSLSIPELEVKLMETPEILETIFQRAMEKLPKHAKTIVANVKLHQPKQEEDLDSE
jgi:hypothetical protein